MSDSPRHLDELDRKILRVLQANSDLSIAEIGDRIGLSATPCWQRIQKLERDRIITGRVALVDQDKIGISLTGYVFVQTIDHSYAWLKRFARFIKGMPEVVEFYRMAGDIDYMLRVATTDRAAFEDVVKRLHEFSGVSNVSCQLVSERIASKTALPVAPLRSPPIKAVQMPGHVPVSDVQIMQLKYAVG